MLVGRIATAATKAMASDLMALSIMDSLETTALKYFRVLDMFGMVISMFKALFKRF